jgi:hypothetical protein
MASKKIYFVEPSKDGYKGTASGAGRAAVTGLTQKSVADQLHNRFPDSTVLAARANDVGEQPRQMAQDLDTEREPRLQP